MSRMSPRDPDWNKGVARETFLNEAVKPGRERLLPLKKDGKMKSFTALVKAAAIAESLQGGGDHDTGVAQLFDKKVDPTGEGSDGSNRLQRMAQESFLLFSFLAIAGLLIGILVNEILWYSAVGFETVDTVFTTILKFAVLVTTVLAYIFAIRYYDLQMQIQRASGVGLSQGFGFMSLSESGLGWYFVVDLLTLAPIPYPFIHFTIEFSDLHHEETPTVYTSDNIFMALMFVRLQFLPRIIAEMWMMANPMAFVKARMHNVVIDTWFVIRALFIANFGTLVLLLTVAMCASSYIVLILERPYPHVDQLAEFLNAFYYTVITMTTVGYGDITTQTLLGRYFALVIAIQGVVFIALIIQGVVERVGLKPVEARIIDFVETTNNANDTRQKAAGVIQAVFRQYKKNIQAIKINGGSTPRHLVRVKHDPRVMFLLRSFCTAKRHQDEAAGLDLNTEATHKGIDQLQDRFDEIEASLNKIMKHLNIE
jgi:hypothetical protein